MRRLLIIIVLISISFPSVSALKWTADTRLTFDPKISEAPDIAIDQSGRVHVAWKNTIIEDEAKSRFEYGEIYYLQLNGRGKVVVGPIKVTSAPNSTGYYGPSIAIDAKNDVHVVWEDYMDGTGGRFSEVYYAKLDKKGDILVGPSIVLSNRSYISSLSIDQMGNLHLGTMSSSMDEAGSFTTDVYYSKLDDMGVKTGVERRLTFRDSYSPIIAVDHDANIHVVYGNRIDPENEIRYTKLDNGGKIYVNDIILYTLNYSSLENYCGGILESFSIGIDLENNLHVVFDGLDFFGNDNIYYTKLDNTGNILIDRIKITDRIKNTSFPELVINPNIAVDRDGSAHIVWRDDKDGEIYYSNRNKNALLTAPNVRLTTDSGYSPIQSGDYHNPISSAPDIAVDGKGNIHVVWADNRDGNFELYYKKGVPIDDIGITPAILSEKLGGFITEIWTHTFQRLKDSDINIYSYIVVLALIFLIIGLYKKKSKPKRKG